MIAPFSHDPKAAADDKFDLIVVGGGIQGALVAWESARRGLRPLLVERDQFGQGTSRNTLRILHGGLRYLQSLNLRRFLESVRERTWWLRQFPDLVSPLGCLMPLYNRGLRRGQVFRVALAVNDYLSRQRNEGIRGDRHIPRGAVFGREETIGLFPAVDTDGLRGGACWYDAKMLDPQRLMSEVLCGACKHGATCLNYVEASKLLINGAHVDGLEAIDHRAGDLLQFRAPVVVNCSGPWCRRLAGRFDRDLPALFQPSIAFNLLLNRSPLSQYAVAVTPKRVHAGTFFLLPLENQILAGTYHLSWEHDVTDPQPTSSQIQSFVHDLNLAVPALQLTCDDVLDVHAGFLPVTAAGSRRSASRALIHDHGAKGGPRGLYTVSGVKFTTSRAVAAAAIRRIFPRERGDTIGKDLDVTISAVPRPRSALKVRPE